MQILYPDLYPIHTIEDKVIYQYDYDIQENSLIICRVKLFKMEKMNYTYLNVLIYRIKILIRMVLIYLIQVNIFMFILVKQ